MITRIVFEWTTPFSVSRIVSKIRERRGLQPNALLFEHFGKPTIEVEDVPEGREVVRELGMYGIPASLIRDQVQELLRLRVRAEAAEAKLAELGVLTDEQIDE